MGRIDYRRIHNTNKDEWKALTRKPQKQEALLGVHYSDSNHFVYELLQNAEVQTIFSLLPEFGTPVKDGEQSVEIAEEEKTETETIASGPLHHRVKSVVEQKSVMSDGTIKDGDFVSYRKLNTLEIMDITIQASQYELHRRFLSKKVGDVMIMGKKYEIISIV